MLLTILESKPIKNKPVVIADSFLNSTGNVFQSVTSRYIVLTDNSVPKIFIPGFADGRDIENNIVKK